jgi:mRNA-degrading endonuclease toxin of MazEF toxin-antitoxin module
MADKISAAPKSKLGRRIGVVADSDMQSLDRALVVILGLAIPIDG